MRKRLSFMKLSYKLKYVLPPVVTAILYCIVLAIKHIYPFGIQTVDYYDMAQQIAAFYYHIYDVLHGTKSLFYDPYTAMSVNMAMSTSGCSHISVFNLFFLFIKRNILLESLSYFLGLKMVCMSASMYIYLHKTRKIPYFFEVIMSVGYAFCGFVMVLYVTIQWMDIAVFFPLIMYFLHKLLREGKSLGYVVMLTMSVVASYYISFMILIYIVLFVGLELFANKVFDKNIQNKESTHLHLSSLLVETLVSILLSAFILIPQLKQTLMSARFTNESSGGPSGMYLNIINTVKPAYTTRWFSLLGLSFSFAIIAVGIVKNRKNKKTLFLSIMSIIFVLSELFIESINLIWHFGSYVQYPIRNGFIIYFTVVVTAAYFIEKDDIKLSGFSHIVIAAVVMVFALYLGIRKYVSLGTLPVRTVFHITAAVMALSFCICLVVYSHYKGKLSGIIPVIVISEIIFYSFIFIGHPNFVTGYSEEPEQEGEYIRICNQLSEGFEIKPDANNDYILSRIKNPDESLNANYGLVLRRPALSNWTHLLNPGLSDSAKKLGYSVQFTRLLDAGGTVFSDALIGVKNIITNSNQNDQLYSLVGSKSVEVDKNTGETGLYNLYECKYTLPFGYVGSETQKIDFNTDDTVSIYNDFYNSLGGTGDIARWIYNDELVENSVVAKKLGSVISFSYSFYISGDKAVYYMANQVDRDDYNSEIKVNGQVISIPSIKEADNTMYPAHFNNNAVFLGTFSDEIVNVEVRFSRIGKNGENIGAVFSPKLLSINLDKLDNLCKEKSNEVSVKAGKAKYLFEVDVNNNKELIVPLSFDKGYIAKVNGKRTEVTSVGDMFLSIPLEEGYNIVTIKFIPDGFKLGLTITVITLLGAISAAVVFNKKHSMLDIPYIDNICFVGFIIVVLLMYIIPIAYGVFKCIT